MYFTKHVIHCYGMPTKHSSVHGECLGDYVVPIGNYIVDGNSCSVRVTLRSAFLCSLSKVYPKGHLNRHLFMRQYWKVRSNELNDGWWKHNYPQAFHSS